MKNVLILSASPRKEGNSDILCRQFEKGAKEAGHKTEMLKTTIDRFLPKWQDLDGHDVYFIITGHDGKEGLRLVGEELTRIFENLGNNTKGIIWEERVWQKGEVPETAAMHKAYQTGLSV